jgi:F0F1-type ATP synthase assembly protein I
MAETDRLAPGNDAPAGSAGADATGSTTPSAAARFARKALLISTAGTSVNPLDRESYAKATNRGYSTAMGRGLELAITLAICCLFGVGLDHLLGTSPVFTIIFSVIGFAGTGVKLKLGYDLEMAEHEKDAVWNRGKTS